MQWQMAERAPTKGSLQLTQATAFSICHQQRDEDYEENVIQGNDGFSKAAFFVIAGFGYFKMSLLFREANSKNCQFCKLPPTHPREAERRKLQVLLLTLSALGQLKRYCICV